MTPTSAPASRILGWEGCFNVRDLGGLRTGDGRRVRSGAIVRADVLSRLTPTGRSALIDHGVRTIVDLRFPDEVARDWDAYPFHGDVEPQDGPPIHYSNVPLNIGRDPAREEEIHAAYRAAPNRVELNRLDLDWSRSGVSAGVAAIADAPPGGVVVHCHGGKDRTGIVIALTLALLEVSDGDIADDYALTTLNLEPLIVDWLDSISDDEIERERLRRLATPAREAMFDTLAYLRSKYGSAEEYLVGGGLSPAQIDRLKDRVLDGRGADG